MNDSDRKHVAAWLLVSAALVFAIVLVGGITRLTRSGLSIVEWQPLIGALPPLSEAAWQELFAKYKATPEGRLVNHAMTLEGFKGIFWWEYIHRLLARVVGLVFLLPLLYFQFRKVLDKALAAKLWGIFALGALQGVVGWYMVKSGLIDDPKVNPLRLTMHLGLAIAIFAAELWVAMDLLRGRARPRRFEASLPLVIYLMALSGGMVAGLRAGYAYNTFPLMNGHFVPPETFLLEPWWQNFLSNMATVQLVHRTFFWLLAILVPIAWWRSRGALSAHALLAAFVLQASLGIATLLNGVPIGLGAAHQGGAVLFLGAALWHAHRRA
ncbi:MAG TPA: COX15/CtaA family protein [Burkholderiales bacterium]|nr:COX15/CtaA family protein [Burkholderiales bacterium]